MKQLMFCLLVGNLSYLPEDIQDLIATAEKVTEKNQEATLNVAFSYTSRYVPLSGDLQPNSSVVLSGKLPVLLIFLLTNWVSCVTSVRNLNALFIIY